MNKKIIIRVALILVLLLALVWVYNYMTTGKLSVETSSENYVTITSVKSSADKNEAIYKQGKHELSARLPPGTYRISASSAAFSTSKTVVVKARQSQYFVLYTPKTSAIEPVISRSAVDVAADASRLNFIDPTTNQLFTIDSGNQIRLLGGSQNFKSATWASPSFGIAQDATNHLYVVNDVSVSQLSLPFEPSEGRSVNYAVALSRSVYVSNGSTIYKGSEEGDFNKLFVDKSDSPKLATTNLGDKVAVYSMRATADEGTEEKMGDSKITVVDKSGDVLGSNDFATAQATWSPNGKYLLARGENGATIFDSRLNKISFVASEGVGSIAWISNSKFLYTDGFELWVYNMTTGTGQKIARTVGSAIQAIYPSSDGTYAYITYSGDDLKLARVNLKGTATPDYTQALDIFLPKTSNGCTVDYVNFVTPPVLTLSYSGNSLQSCRSMALQLMSYYNISSGQFNMVPIQVTEGE